MNDKYGSSKKYNYYLRRGSIWNEPRDWMMALQKKERTLVTYWTADEKSNLPSDIKAIALRAFALGSEKGYLKLVYEFPNFGECVKEDKEASKGAL